MNRIRHDHYFDFSRTCVHCGEDYDLAEHIPYWLPSPCQLHPLCLRCLLHLLNEKEGHFVVCPECDEEHFAPNGIDSFQPHMYLVSIVRTRRSLLDGHFQSCKKHDNPMKYYCGGSQCETVFCISCSIYHQDGYNGLEHRTFLLKEEAERRIVIQATRAVTFIEKTQGKPLRE